MTKSRVIFSDEDNNQQEEPIKPARNRGSVSLSRDDYRHIIETAYNEGRKDALDQKEKTSEDSNNEDKHTKKVEQEGTEEAIQEHAKEKETNRQRFKTITERHDIELLRAGSVFPFTIFADTIIIDTTKISIAKKQLFSTEYIITIPLKDLGDVNVQTVLFLGSLFLKYMPQSTSPGMLEPVNVRIPNLRREDAIKAKNILKGVLVARAEEIDIAKLSPKEIAEVLHKFGETEGVI